MGKFTESRREVLIDALERIGFGLLISGREGELEATHLPIQVLREDGDGLVLRGHLGAGNPHVKALRSGSPVLFVCQGPQAYISPSWYATKRQTGAVVPTWNYIAVHVHGRVSIQSEEQLREHVSALTDRFEASSPEPWAVGDAPPEYVANQVRGIVGVEIASTRLEGHWKVSQNRTREDREGVVAGLRERARGDDAAMAALVEATLTEAERR